MKPQNTLGISIKAIVLSVFLIIILTASNAYLGLKVGTTIAASIPAVVIAMGIFRLFASYNVQEINIVQTAAAASEGITGGLAFTLPALLIIHFWLGFNYWETALIGIIGGITGVLCSIPLRRALLNDKTLRFPEGTAIGEVMKASTDADKDIKPIITGGIVGALIALCQDGFRVLAQGYDYWVIKHKAVFGYSLGFSPAVIAAGYICGITVGISMLVGVLFGWILGVPLLTLHYGFSHTAKGIDIANQVWSAHIRYIGVGTMLVGGIWTLITLAKPVVKAIHASTKALHLIRNGEGHKISHTDRDIPINILVWGMTLAVIALLLTLFSYVSPATLGLHLHTYIIAMLLCAIIFMFIGFIFSAISAYFVGLVGVTNSPASGIMVSTVLLLSLVLYAVASANIHFNPHTTNTVALAGLAIIVCAFISAAVVIAGESVQVTKAGSMVKATPWVQQTALIIGTVIASLTLPLVLNLLYNAYGIGGIFPRAGMSHGEMLAAPQAALMAAIAQAVFNQHIPWLMISIGAIFAVICIICDEIIKTKFNKRLIVLAVGLGIYLPLNVSIPTIIGGFVAYFVDLKRDPENKKGYHNAMFLTCGIIAGATLMGVVLAIPFAIFKSTDVLRLVPHSFAPISGILAIAVTLGLCYWIYKTAIRK